MNLTEVKVVAERMKKYAKEHPFKPLEVFLKRTMPKTYQESFEYEGYDLLITLTLDEIETKRAWHVSFGANGSGLEIPARVYEELIRIFLPCKNNLMEIPSMHGKLVRQFLEFA